MTKKLTQISDEHLEWLNNPRKSDSLPRKIPAVRSVTLSYKGKSVVLRPEFRAKADAALEKMTKQGE